MRHPAIDGVNASCAVVAGLLGGSGIGAGGTFSAWIPGDCVSATDDSGEGSSGCDPGYSSTVTFLGDGIPGPAAAPSTAGCFVKGVVAGAATALVVAAVATVAAPVVGATAVTVGLAAVAVAGAASLGWTARQDIRNNNWAGVAYDAGSLVGGFATGTAVGPRVATAIDPNATPGWSPQSWWAQRYRPSRGSVGDFMGSGPTHASGGASTGAGGWLSSLFGAGCH